MKREDKKKIRKYLDMKYPIQYHDLEIELILYYIAGLCTSALRNFKDLGHCILDIDDESKFNIEKIISSEKNEDTEYLSLFYSKTIEAIELLKKYYNEDGTKK